MSSTWLSLDDAARIAGTRRAAIVMACARGELRLAAVQRTGGRLTLGLRARWIAELSVSPAWRRRTDS